MVEFILLGDLWFIHVTTTTMVLPGSFLPLVTEYVSYATGDDRVTTGRDDRS